MGITERMNQVGDKLQTSMKSSFYVMSFRLVQVLSGFILGLTLALVAQEAMQFGSFALWFMTFTVLGLFWKFTSSWSLFKMLIFDLICVLAGMCLKMYVLIAP